MVKREKPDLVCCRCQKVFGKDSRRLSYVFGIPCPDCKPIVDRKDLAFKIRYRRKQVKFFSKWAKYLNKMEEEDGQKRYTPMRYVSAEEIRSISPTEYSGVPVMNKSETAVFAWQIFLPGYYRVTTTNSGRRVFKSACSDGLPTHWNNLTYKIIEQKIYAEINDGKEKARSISYQRKIKREKEESRQSMIKAQSMRPSASANQFFTAMAMVGSVKRKIA